jgi:SAM-dependent methyltransferase
MEQHKKTGQHAADPRSSPLPKPWVFVEETRFGDWFLSTQTWKTHVLCRALDELMRYLPPGGARYPQILDVGCGFGHSFSELAKRFAPDLIVGLDAVSDLTVRAQTEADACQAPVRLHQASASDTGLPSGQFDMIFCHQTFHHIVEQEAALAEFFRVLKPGGVLLFAESTKRYIHSLPIKLLFRHPMQVQKTAEEYVGMIRKAGLELPDSRIGLPYLWWSRPDIGFLEWIGVPVPEKREATLINAVAVKPLDV